jgi:hypothetical protein
MISAAMILENDRLVRPLAVDLLGKAKSHIFRTPALLRSRSVSPPLLTSLTSVQKRSSILLFFCRRLFFQPALSLGQEKQNDCLCILNPAVTDPIQGLL